MLKSKNSYLLSLFHEANNNNTHWAEWHIISSGFDTYCLSFIGDSFRGRVDDECVLRNYNTARGGTERIPCVDSTSRKCGEQDRQRHILHKYHEINYTTFIILNLTSWCFHNRRGWRERKKGGSSYLTSSGVGCRGTGTVPVPVPVRCFSLGDSVVRWRSNVGGDSRTSVRRGRRTPKKCFTLLLLNLCVTQHEPKCNNNYRRLHGANFD